jgi:dTMP kinase
MNLFITLEGPEGSGKSTQAPRLADHLRQKGWNVLLTREPGGTPIGDQIRAVLHDLGNTSMHPRTELLLYSASRAQIVNEVIRGHLASGGTVVSDRYADSSMAYQGYGQGLPLEDLRTITAFATGGLTPDLTFLLDLPVSAGLARRRGSDEWNRLDAYQIEFHERVRAGYAQMVAADPKRWVVVDADLDSEKVWQQMREKLEAWLAAR